MKEQGKGGGPVRARRSVRAILGAVVSVVAAPAGADDAVESSPVVVTGTRTEARSFDLPMSIDSIPQDDIQRGKLDVNVSEVLNRAPGTFVQNRDNFAQEQQISIRGFGARSQFGTRGIRLLADGIPASSPDGQGSPGIFDLGSADRIEVLRGPFSALYGNHSGGVVQIFTEPGPAQPIMTPSFTFGSYDTQRYGFKFGGQGGPLNYMVNTTYFTTNGYREQSAAEKTQVNGKFVYTIDNRSAFTLVANIFDQPNAEDPLGLTAQQVARNPRQADPAATLFDTRRTLRNSQVGLIYDNRITDEDTLRVMGYYGTRSNTQYLAIPLVNQNDIRSSGGVSTFDRDFGGGSLRWTRVQPFFSGPLTVTSGVDYETASDSRQGYLNNLGDIGALKRNEDDTVDNFGAYVQAEWQFLPRWNASAGIRYSEVRFDSRDKFICVIVGTRCSGTTTIVGPGPAQRNPDDSGSATYSAWTPVGGLLYQLTSAVNLYANAGRSFETPTFIELAYRPDGSSGLNFNLQPTLSNQYEIGAKAFVGTGTRVNFALFYIDSSNEVVIARNVGGRAAYQNASGTTRKGAELLIDSDLGAGFNGYLAATYLNAEFSGDFVTCAGPAPCIPATGTNVAVVQSGNRVPGVPEYNLFGSLTWRYAPFGLTTAVEAIWNGNVYVNDLNTEAAASYAILNWWGGLQQQSGPWSFREFVRVNNIFDKAYIGAVNVGDANGRYYYPAPTRNYLVGLSVIYQF
ncbi:MAG TPA: TonB-dependent receptor [Burkholderiales bacterium]|nr:TonB-dependent receptor [Burkholderiales bacterium]